MQACAWYAQEKIRREERLQQEKERKAAEAQQKQAEAKRLAGQRAEERERKLKESVSPVQSGQN